MANNPDDSVNEWMSRIVPGKTFTDIGGLWGTIGERVSMAAKHNPASLTMIDTTPDESLWDAFRKRLKDKGIDEKTVRQIRADVEAPGFAQKAGKYDVVYCSGLLYHSPNPMHFLWPLSDVVGEYLIFGSIVLADRFRGLLGLPYGMPLSVFVAALDDVQRKFVADAYKFHDSTPAVGISHPVTTWVCNTPREGGLLHNTAPFWWLYCPVTVASMLNLAGFDVLDNFPGWEDRVMFYVCKKR